MGNIPPIIPFNCHTLLLQSNRFLVENISTKGLHIKARIRCFIERNLFKFFIKNIDRIVVQSNTMKELTNIKTKYKKKCFIFAFKNNFSITDDTLKKQYDFIYIASDENYKNHSNLLKAWVKLSDEQINYSLCLVVPKNSVVKKEVNSLMKINQKLKIYVFDNNERSMAMKLLKQSKSLVYPSKFESYALPIVEAKMHNLNIIAAEKDYVRDLCDPDETFDPESPTSLYRAIKRFFNKKDKKTKIVDAGKFINFVVSTDKLN